VYFPFAEIGCSGKFEADVARAKYVEWKLQHQQSRFGASASRLIVVEDEGNPEDDPA
jgi:hypothetical protein